MSEEMGSPVRDRIYELADDESPDVLGAVMAFTVPCRLCVPGAKALGALVPFWFIVEGHEEDADDEVEAADEE